MSSNDRRSSMARVAGSIYLAAMALSMFTQVYVPGKIVVPGDVAAVLWFLIKGVRVQQ